VDNPLTSEKQNAVIDDALHTYPVMLLPRDVTVDVMARIQTLPTPRPCRLTWSDLALAFVLSLCVGAIWFSLNNLPPLVIVQIRKENILFYQYMLVNARWLVPLLSFGVSGFLIVVTLLFLKQELTKKST
jgi:hypothetical protein